ncbi:MAG TPA: DinB family protein [Chloroflexota bacterium]|nr:DinB family protein [Chloroflexota bacterium]
MSREDTLRQHVLDHLARATDRGFEEAIRDFPLDAINARPPRVDYTPWHLVEHLRIGQWDILEYIRNPNHVSPKWPDEYWPKRDAVADAASWAQTIDRFRADRAALAALVADPATDLLAPIPHTPGHTVLREVFLVAGHSAGHLGEFSILRQIMDTWPSR